jgi:hypothetical protein
MHAQWYQPNFPIQVDVDSECRLVTNLSTFYLTFNTNIYYYLIYCSALPFINTNAITITFSLFFSVYRLMCLSMTWSDGWVAEQNAKEKRLKNKRNKVEYYLIWVHEKNREVEI